MSKYVYLYRGEEKYLTNVRIQKIISDSKVDELNLTTYDCQEVNLENAIRDAKTEPFLSKVKVVIIKNPQFLESDKTNHNVDLLINYLENPNEDTILIINASGMKVNDNTKAMKALLKEATVVNTNAISEEEFKAWLKTECSNQGNVVMKNSSAELFYKTMGVDLTTAKTEVDKMITYVGPDGVIDEEVTKMLLYKTNQNEVYNLTNAIFNKDKDSVMNIYYELTKYEKDPTVLINLITRSFKDTLLVKLYDMKGLNQNTIASKMKMSSGRIYYILKNAKNYDLEDIESNIQKLANLDLKIKTGAIDKRIGFEEFLLSI